LGERAAWRNGRPAGRSWEKEPEVDKKQGGGTAHQRGLSIKGREGDWSNDTARDKGAVTQHHNWERSSRRRA